MSYSLLAAKGCRLIDDVYFSTEDREMKNVARWYGAKVIDRPRLLATDTALGEDVFVHAYKEIRRMKSITNVELVVVLLANAPSITSLMLTQMIEKLQSYSSYDSICTVSEYNMFSPSRARRIEGCRLVSYMVQQELENCGITCNRDSCIDTYYYDCSAAVVKPRCLEDIENGDLPQRWLGRKVLSYKQKVPCCDVDYKWQLGQIEYWLKEHNVHKCPKDIRCGCIECADFNAVCPGSK